MTEVVNVQVFSFVHEKICETDFEHKGIKFHLETFNYPSSQLNLLTEKSLKVFVNLFYDDNDIRSFTRNLNYLKHNGIKTKSLILELTYFTQKYSDKEFENLDINAEYMLLEREQIYNSEQFKDKLLEMALENEEVIESSVINSIFSEFLNKGKIEKNVIREFCVLHSLDLSKCLNILKENNNLFEYSDGYYFIHDKCVEFFTNIEKYDLKNKIENGLLSYEELERLFENDTDIAIKILETKNVLIKNQNNYAYLFSGSAVEIDINPYLTEGTFSGYISSEPMNINIHFLPKDVVNINLIFRKISSNRKISLLGRNFILIDDNCFIVFRRIGGNSIFFFKEYDFEIIKSLLRLINVKNLTIEYKYDFRIGIKQFKNFLKEQNFNNYTDENVEEKEQFLNMMREIYQFFEPS